MFLRVSVYRRFYIALALRVRLRLGLGKWMKNSCQDTGNLAIAFFDEKNREKVLDLYINKTEGEKNILRDLHQRFSIILRIISSKSHVSDDFEEYCTSTYKIILQKFPWMQLSETLHRLLAHAPEVIRYVYRHTQCHMLINLIP